MAQRHQMTLDHQRYKCLMLPCSSTDVGNRNYIEREIKLLEKKNKPIIDVGTVLFRKKDTDEFTTVDVSNINLLQANFLANSVLPYRSVQYLNQILVSSDTDQSAIVGNYCCCIKECKFKYK